MGKAMANAIKFAGYALALSASGKVWAAPCGAKPDCPPEYGIEAQQMHDAYLNAQSSQERSQIDQIIISSTIGGKVDWTKACLQFKYCSTKPIYDFTEYDESVKKAQFERAKKMRDLMRVSEIVIKSQLKDPQSAIVEWSGQFTGMNFKPPFAKRIEGFGGCGFVNAKNSFGGYVGKRRFIVIFKDINGGLSYSGISSGGDWDFIEVQCSDFRFEPIKVVEAPTTEASTGNLGITGQLEALVKLRDTGALTPAEFDRAKAKLLGLD